MSYARWWKRYSLKRQEKNKPHSLDEFEILGIDPGSINCGYGLLKTINNKKSAFTRHNLSNFDCVYITSGRITLPHKRPLYLRLKKLYDELIHLIREHKPREMVVESMFFAKSVKAALALGQARGTVLLAAASEGLSVYEYTALEVKKAVTGYGNAEKNQVQDMVMRILNLKSHPEFNSGANLSEDSADALAIALCHLNTIRFKERITS
jgi:crossover junction endodeoxyribonuclease RuvC